MLSFGDCIKNDDGVTLFSGSRIEKTIFMPQDEIIVEFTANGTEAIFYYENEKGLYQYPITNGRNKYIIKTSDRTVTFGIKSAAKIFICK